jgi:hypothetical protein
MQTGTLKKELINVKDLLTSSTPALMEIVLEYAELASIQNPSEVQADRLGEILSIASENELLNFWLTEMDHFMGHHLGLLNEDHRESYKDQQALLREHRGERARGVQPCSGRNPFSSRGLTNLGR